MWGLGSQRLEGETLHWLLVSWDGKERKTEPNIGFSVCGLEGMENKIENAIMGYVRTTIRIPFLHS